VPMLQLLCNTFKANILDANASVTTRSFIYASLEDSVIVIGSNNIVARIVIINGQVLQISQKDE